MIEKSSGFELFDDPPHYQRTYFSIGISYAERKRRCIFWVLPSFQDKSSFSILSQAFIASPTLPERMYIPLNEVSSCFFF